jgi:hypothetical protein
MNILSTRKQTVAFWSPSPPGPIASALYEAVLFPPCPAQYVNTTGHALLK